MSKARLRLDTWLVKQGVKGGWIFVRDAVKRALPVDAPKPGKFRIAGAADHAVAVEAPAVEAAATEGQEGA